jgi:hypothetical protein
VDVDEGGNAAGALAQSSVIDGFLKEKFKATAASSAAKASVLSGDEAAILAQAKALGAKRLVSGQARIESVSKDGTAFVAVCRLVLSALDVESGTILASSDRVATSIGSSEAEARSNAFRDSGKSAVKDLMSKL